MANTDDSPGMVDITLLHYRFRFKKLMWRDEMAIKVGKGKDPVRTVLAHALGEVSGIRPSSVEEAERVIAAIPDAIAMRVWKVYRGSFPPARRFSTANLYRAPEPSAYMGKILEEDEIEDNVHDRAVREMESKFGKREVAEEAELSRRILEAAQKDGKKFPPATPEKGAHCG